MMAHLYIAVVIGRIVILVFIIIFKMQESIYLPTLFGIKKVLVWDGKIIDINMNLLFMDLRLDQNIIGIEEDLKLIYGN